MPTPVCDIAMCKKIPALKCQLQRSTRSLDAFIFTFFQKQQQDNATLAVFFSAKRACQYRYVPLYSMRLSA